MTDCIDRGNSPRHSREVVESSNRQKISDRGVGCGEEMGASKASLCVEIDGLDFPRKDLGHLHRDDLCHHFWKVHTHHVGLD